VISYPNCLSAKKTYHSVPAYTANRREVLKPGLDVTTTNNVLTNTIASRMMMMSLKLSMK